MLSAKTIELELAFKELEQLRPLGLKFDLPRGPKGSNTRNCRYEEIEKTESIFILS